jgi:hypothetical protein
MAPDSADVEMEGEFVDPRTPSEGHYYFRQRSWKSLIETDEFVVPRPDTEDEDTEQKIINEGMSFSW